MKSILALLFTLLVSPALAGETSNIDYHCLPMSKISDIGKYRVLSHDEWLSIRTIFRVAPNTPDSWPPGKEARIILAPSDNGDIAAIVLFIDGTQACAPMPLTKDVVDILKQVRDGTLTHSGHPS